MEMSYYRKYKNKIYRAVAILIIVFSVGYQLVNNGKTQIDTSSNSSESIISDTSGRELNGVESTPTSEEVNDGIEDDWNIPSYDGVPVIVFNDNIPTFSCDSLLVEPELKLSELDLLGRTGRAYAVCGPETTTYEQRGSIADIRPSGWHTVRYDDLIEDKYLFNRCHQIGWSIYGAMDSEAINSKLNLFTGTRQLNLTMLEYEIQILDYIDKFESHVMYEVTPLFNDFDSLN